MNVERPNPDELLARVQAADAGARRGKLKIFFGYAAGVGKTYAMLEAARREKAAGVEVVVGYVEPHGRRDTEALVEGLEAIAPKLVPYRGVMLREFDLDAALARKPHVILVDELAHTNAEGLRHAKRWQDVEELLEAGINVYSTLNVQHVESLNDVVAQITGVIVRETLPDAVLERADDIELVDLTPEELIERLQDGKVYVPQQAERALQSFFHKANLVALREMSLRQAAQRLRQDVDAARMARAVQKPWATSERLLVCVGPSPTSAKLVRTAKRMAAAFGADWLAVAVEPPGAGAAVAAARQRLAHHLQLADRLGAETHTLIGEDVAQTVLDFARSRNVTKLIIGKTAVSRRRRLVFGTVVDTILDGSGDIDVYVIRGEPEVVPAPRNPQRRTSAPWSDYGWAGAVVGVCGAAAWLSDYFGLPDANVVMVLLLGVALVATRYGRGPALAAAAASVLLFDFVFVPPRLTFAVSDVLYLPTFAVMLAIGVIISALTSRIKDQLGAARHLQNRTAALFRLTKQLGEIAGPEFLIQAAGRQLGEIFDGEVVLLAKEPQGSFQWRYGQGTSVAAHEINGVVAEWVADHDQVAGAGTDTLPNATALFVPLIGSQRTLGAVGVRPSDPERFLEPEQRQLLQTCASLIALSLERDQSVLEASEAQARVKEEQLRNALLSSVSHDLRTPLAAIRGAGTSLLEAATAQDAGTRRELLQSIADEAQRMARLVDNLLDMTRLSSGNVTVNRQWHVLEEIVGSALGQLRRELAGHTVKVSLPHDLPLLFFDGTLLEQVFFNLLENAGRYTPAGTRIEITARVRGAQVDVIVADDGPGLPPGSEAKVFEKFYRGGAAASDGRRGVGLGLAICQAIVQAHRGQISARNRPEGGAEFRVTLPCEQPPPRVALDDVPESAPLAAAAQKGA